MDKKEDAFNKIKKVVELGNLEISDNEIVELVDDLSKTQGEKAGDSIRTVLDKIKFENGSTIECIKSEDSTRGKGWFIGIDLAKENDYTAMECPQCYSINSFKSNVEYFNCLECGYKLF